MRVFVDSNVLISALATRGISSDLMEMLIISCDIVISKQVVNEVLDKLEIKFKYPTDRLEETENYLNEFIVVDNPEKIVYSLRDQDDEVVLAGVIGGNCKYLLTGDKDLLDERNRVKEISIVSPRELWHLLKS